jgi:hypothetical protein
MTNVPPAPQPRVVTTPTPSSRRNQLIILAVFVVVLVLLIRACSPHENKYEHIAHDFTQAIQRNDYNAVAKLENVETAANMRRAAFGHAVDDLAPLGKIVHVKENTPPGGPPRVHEFDVAFQNGTVHERFNFDPTDKVVRFKFDLPQKTK